ncbi:hypothetical protein APR11_004235 [Nocardia amikacinitolerans]|nr:hypothetical protein [Nocardia amikacinitolerans]
MTAVDAPLLELRSVSESYVSVAVLTAASAVGICLVGVLVPAIGAGRATVAEALAER